MHVLDRFPCPARAFAGFCTCSLCSWEEQKAAWGVRSLRLAVEEQGVERPGPAFTALLRQAGCCVAFAGEALPSRILLCPIPYFCLSEDSGSVSSAQAWPWSCAVFVLFLRGMHRGLFAQVVVGEQREGVGSGGVERGP